MINILESLSCDFESVKSGFLRSYLNSKLRSKIGNKIKNLFTNDDLSSHNISSDPTPVKINNNIDEI